jgi:hypothetical protein
MHILSKYKLEIIGLAAGAVLGFGYWYFVGCSSGACAITSNPVNSTLYGSVMGSLLLSIFKKGNKKNEINAGNNK